MTDDQQSASYWIDILRATTPQLTRRSPQTIRTERTLKDGATVVTEEHRDLTGEVQAAVDQAAQLVRYLNSRLPAMSFAERRSFYQAAAVHGRELLRITSDDEKPGVERMLAECEAGLAQLAQQEQAAATDA